MPSPRPKALVTLTTDFGSEDSYVAEMKGVLCSQGPDDLRVIDLSHALPPQDIVAGILFLEAAVPRFPAGTIHLVVIDPGVGSARRALFVQYRGQILVVPDNGVASAALRDEGIAFEIDHSSLGLGPLCATFHGRDLFAPAAACLARGLRAEQLSTPISDPVIVPSPKLLSYADTILGEGIHVDHFGNLITNIQRSDLPKTLGPEIQVLCGPRCLSLANHYAELPLGEPLALFGSQDRLEIAVRNGNAADTLGLGRGDKIRVALA